MNGRVMITRERSRALLRTFSGPLVALLVMVSVLGAYALTSTPEPARAASLGCGPNDANRASLKTAHGDIQLRPCISGANLRIKVGSALDLSGPYTVSEIRVLGQDDVKMADGSTQKLWHVSFAAFEIARNASLVTTDAKGAQTKITPDSAAKLGGKDDAGNPMYTDVWASAGSFNIDILKLTCVLPIDISSSLVKVVDGGNIRGCGLSLDAKYIVAYPNNPSTQGNYPVRLPNTTLEAVQ